MSLKYDPDFRAFIRGKVRYIHVTHMHLIPQLLTVQIASRIWDCMVLLARNQQVCDLS